MKAKSSPDTIAACVAKIGCQKIQLDGATSSVHLPEAGMKIGFDAIGKEYAADRARELLCAHSSNDRNQIWSANDPGAVKAAAGSDFLRLYSAAGLTINSVSTRILC